jgi:hypothetical protein
MTDISLSIELAKAVPVVVGGLLAVVGGVGGQLLTHWLTRKREKTNLRRERLEALVKAVYQYKRWVSDKSTLMIFRNEDHDVPSPLDEANMIQSLYFPELATEILAVEKAFMPILKFINEQRIQHMKSKEEFIAKYDPKPLHEAYELHLAAVNVLVKKCRSLLVA